MSVKQVVKVLKSGIIYFSEHNEILDITMFKQDLK